MAGGREEIRYPCPSQARFQSKACRKRFLHYYWYVLDPVMGPMSVRVASYFPFNVACYLNGHSFVAQERARCFVTKKSSAVTRASTFDARLRIECDLVEMGLSSSAWPARISSAAEGRLAHWAWLVSAPEARSRWVQSVQTLDISGCGRGRNERLYQALCR